MGLVDISICLKLICKYVLPFFDSHFLLQSIYTIQI